MSTDTLRSLLARVEAAKADDDLSELETDLVIALLGEDAAGGLKLSPQESPYARPSYYFVPGPQILKHLGETVGTVEQVLPDYALSMHRQVALGRVTYWIDMGGKSYDGPTFALALIRAALATLIAREGRTS